jgi:filamentous hemagglutinin
VASASLYKTDPNLTWEQVVQKYSNKGFQGDALYQEIINAAQRSRTSVNQSLGIK